MTDQRPYAALLAKGEDRRQRILATAQRLLTRNGWRSTTLGQIARESGVTAAGLLHHFENKEALLHAVLEARDIDDLAHTDLSGDLISQIKNVVERFQRAPDLVGMFAVLLIENLAPETPLHGRLLARYRVAVDSVAEGIRRGQDLGHYRTDLDPVVKAAEVVAFITGMETLWLLDPSIPVSAVFQEYADSLARQLAAPSDLS
jgi:AcrR family transcriptional regulator